MPDAIYKLFDNYFENGSSSYRTKKNNIISEIFNSKKISRKVTEKFFSENKPYFY
jgi:hypothetical protein